MTAETLERSAEGYLTFLRGKSFGKAWKVLATADDWARGDLAQTRRGDLSSTDWKAAARRCVVGAMLEAYADDVEFVAAYIRLGLAVWERFQTTIELWNDAPETVFEDLRSLLVAMDI